MSQRTPGPWRAIKRGVGEDWVIIPQAHAQHAESWILAELRYQANDQVNAEFIVRAVNSHDSLLAALKGIIELADAQIKAGDKRVTLSTGHLAAITAHVNRAEQGG